VPQIQRQSQQTQQAKQEPPPEVPGPRFDFDNPEESVDKRVEKKLQTWAAQQKQYQQQQEHYEATQNFMRGRSAAIQRNPELYEGIEKEVENAVWQGYRGGIVSKWDLSNETAWEDTAWLIHKRNKNWDKLVPPKQPPVSPTQTDTPGGIRPPGVEPPGEPLEFDAHGKEMLDLAEKAGVKRDEFIKDIKSRRKQFGSSREGR